MPGAQIAKRAEKARSHGSRAVRDRDLRQEGPGEKYGPETRVLRVGATLTQSELPLLVSQRALGHHLQIQHWFCSPGRGGLSAAAQMGLKMKRQSSS